MKDPSRHFFHLATQYMYRTNAKTPITLREGSRNLSKQRDHIKQIVMLRPPSSCSSINAKQVKSATRCPSIPSSNPRGTFGGTLFIQEDSAGKKVLYSTAESSFWSRVRGRLERSLEWRSDTHGTSGFLLSHDLLFSGLDGYSKSKVGRVLWSPVSKVLHFL